MTNEQDLTNGVATEMEQLAESRVEQQRLRVEQTQRAWDQQFREVSNQRHVLQERIDELHQLLGQEYKLFRRELDMCRTLAARRDQQCGVMGESLQRLAAWIDERGLTAEYERWCNERKIPF